MLDMTASIAPKSDQANADDLMAGPRTCLITEVRRGSSDQPIEVVTDQFDGRPWRPSKTDRRVLVAAWGVDGSTYVGKRIRLYRDATVKWAGEAVGGIRIEAMSGLDKPLKLAVTVTRGKKAPYVVQPLKDETPAAKAPTIAKVDLDAIIAGLDDLGFTEKAGKLAVVRDVVQRDIRSAVDLTADEGAAVLAWIVATNEDIGEAREHEDALPAEDPPAGWDDAQVAQVRP